MDDPQDGIADLTGAVPVRFAHGELEIVEAAARTAGLALSTYIRNAALAATDVVDLDAAHQDLASLAEHVERLRRYLGEAS